MSLYSSLTQVLAPFAAKINGLLTGWDGTRYSTPGEAVRQQIADLHVLIGDEPGTAIQSSAVAYGDSDVETALDDVNGRLQLQNGELYEDGASKTVGSTTNNYKMNSEGANVSDSNFVVEKYAVVAGTLLHITTQKDSDGVWCYRLITGAVCLDKPHQRGGFIQKQNVAVGRELEGPGSVFSVYPDNLHPLLILAPGGHRLWLRLHICGHKLVILWEHSAPPFLLYGLIIPQKSPCTVRGLVPKRT